VTVTAVWHVGFSVRDLDRSIAFWRDGMGLRLRHRQVQENEYTSQLVGYPNVRLEMAQFEILDGSNPPSGHIIELIEYQRPRGEAIEPENARMTSAHIALQVENIDNLRTRLQAHGATFLSPTQAISEGINVGGKAVYGRDPDGVTFELVEAPARLSAPNAGDLE
jgi:catechol 2,3-dioxygenase-like lactoylglutathione lyase family enzyme